MSNTRLVWREFHDQRRSFMRDPQAMFFAIGLPLLYVVIFVSLFGNQTINLVYDGQPGPLKAHTIMLAGFVAIGVVSATFFNLAVNLVQERESGILYASAVPRCRHGHSSPAMSEHRSSSASRSQQR